MRSQGPWDSRGLAAPTSLPCWKRVGCVPRTHGISGPKFSTGTKAAGPGVGCCEHAPRADHCPSLNMWGRPRHTQQVTQVAPAQSECSRADLFSDPGGGFALFLKARLQHGNFKKKNTHKPKNAPATQRGPDVPAAGTLMTQQQGP